MSEEFEYKIASVPVWTPWVPTRESPRTIPERFRFWVEQVKWSMAEAKKRKAYRNSPPLDLADLLVIHEPPPGMARNPQPFVSEEEWLNRIVAEGWELVSSETPPVSWVIEVDPVDGKRRALPRNSPKNYTFRRPRQAGAIED